MQLVQLVVALGPGGNRYRPERGYLLAHSPNREVVWRAVMGMASGQEAYVFFNAPEGRRPESALLIYRLSDGGEIEARQGSRE